MGLMAVGVKMGFENKKYILGFSLEQDKLEEIRDILGLRQSDLMSGATIYRLTRVPDEHEFLPRGYSTLIDGVRSRPTGDASSAYRPGYGAFQIELLVDVEATLVATLKPGERFEPGVHPGLRHLYPDTLRE